MLRNVSPEAEFAELTEALIGEMHDVIAGIKKPAELSEAEERLLEARESRADAWETYRARISDISAARVPRGDESDKLVHQAKAQVDERDRWIRHRMREVDDLRDRHAAALEQLLGRYRQVAALATHAAATILVETNAAAAREHRKLPEVLEHAPTLNALVAAVHAAQAAKLAGDDRAFDRAAAAIGRPKAQSTAAPMRGKMKLSDALGIAPPEFNPEGFRVDPTTGRAIAAPAAPRAAGRSASARIAASVSGIAASIANPRGRKF